MDNTAPPTPPCLHETRCPMKNITFMSGVDFIDSNVLIYLFDRADPRRRGIAEGLIAPPRCRQAASGSCRKTCNTARG